MFYDEEETMGDHRSAMIRFAESLMCRKPITLHRNSKRSWLHMNDAVQALENLMFVEKYEAVNIGHPNVVETEYIARYMCDKTGVAFDEYVNVVDLPGQMTLEKHPGLDKQKSLLGFEPKISIEEGMDRVLAKVSERLDITERAHNIYNTNIS